MERLGKNISQWKKTSDDIDNELKAANDSVAVLKREYKKIINYPHPVCANNGDDTVYIHADGHTTWNSKE